MKMKKILVTGALAFGLCLSLGAQTVNSAYFMEGSKIRHRLNPAFTPTSGYVAIPALGNFNWSVGSNVGLSTFLYPRDGELTTFMSSSVDADEFLGKLRDNNVADINASFNIASAGFRGLGGYNTVELSYIADAYANTPKALYAFAKLAGQQTEHHIGSTNMSMRGYFELAFGHSRSIGDRLDVGAKVKLLMGNMSVDMGVDNLDITMSGDKWSIRGEGRISATGIVRENSGALEVTPKGVFNMGFGAAVDLGASFELIDGLTLSAALVDLGFISYGNAWHGKTASDSWTFEGFEEFSLDSEKDNSLGNQVTSLTEDLQDLLLFETDPSKSGKTDMLQATLNVGAEYQMPFYDKLSAGLLFSQRFSRLYPKTEARIFATVRPAEWFEASVNYGLSNHGSTFGAAICFDCKGFGFFLSTDNILLNFTPPVEPIGLGFPLNRLNLGLTLGLTINFGGRS